MLEEYDIDKLNPRPNPYAKELNKQVTVKIAPSVIEFFKDEAMEMKRWKLASRIRLCSICIWMTVRRKEVT